MRIKKNEIMNFLNVLIENYEAAKTGREEDFAGTTKKDAVLETYEDLISIHENYGATNAKKSGIELIAEERKRQIEVEGWTLNHDKTHLKGELAEAAAYYAITHEQRVWTDKYMADCNGGKGSSIWPWEPHWFKPGPTRIRELVKAGALIAAEIDRLQNLNPQPSTEQKLK